MHMSESWLSRLDRAISSLLCQTNCVSPITCNHVIPMSNSHSSTDNRAALIIRAFLRSQERRADIMEWCVLSHFSSVQLFETSWTAVRQAPLSKQKYWSGLPCPPPGNLPHPGIKRAFLISPALTGGFFTLAPNWEALWNNVSMSHIAHSDRLGSWDTQILE